MLVIAVTFSLVVLVQARKETCSGIDISSFPDFQFTDLARNYNSFFYVDTQNVPSGRPLAPQVRFQFGGPKSNKAIYTLEGNLPENGGCLFWEVTAYSRFQNRPCITERLMTPAVRCNDGDEWLYYQFAADKFAFFFCGEFNADGSCARKIIRGMSTKSQLSATDIEAFRAVYKKFGEPLPPMDDPANNDCQKITNAKAELAEAARRLSKRY